MSRYCYHKRNKDINMNRHTSMIQRSGKMVTMCRCAKRIQLRCGKHACDSLCKYRLQKHVYMSTLLSGWQGRVTMLTLPMCWRRHWHSQVHFTWFWSHVTINRGLELQNRHNGSLTKVFVLVLWEFPLRNLKLNNRQWRYGTCWLLTSVWSLVFCSVLAYVDN